MVFEFLVRVGDYVMCLVITAQRTVYCILHHLEEKGQFKLKAAYPQGPRAQVNASGMHFFCIATFLNSSGIKFNQHVDCSLSFVHQIGFSPKRNDAALNVS